MSTDDSSLCPHPRDGDREIRTLITWLLAPGRLPIAPCHLEYGGSGSRTHTAEGLSLRPLPDWAMPPTSDGERI
jgi:hypothetical protein